ncbi:hypothetical protein CLOM_g6845 [Closterium sp. NIES-68]|nr:hypothetical protein CLOM_g6845 [Closterium sp. NIES-68]GJP72380.1 hypothetical protein CLOP_g3119 [Closterium sp. NIES-67]
MATSRTLALVYALPLLALLLTSHCISASADVALADFSSGVVPSNEGDLAHPGVSSSAVPTSTRRVLGSDEEKAKDEEKKRKKAEKKAADKAKKAADKAAKKAKSSKSPPPAEPSPSPPAPSTPPSATTTKSPKSPKTPKTPAASPPSPPTTKTGKSPETPPAPAAGAKAPPKKPSAQDVSVTADLTAAAKLVDEAKAVLTVKTYVKSLTDTAQALRNAGILITQGQRALVPGQITNAISTIKGVSVMLKPATDKATLGLLKSAQAKAETAQAAFKP